MYLQGKCTQNRVRRWLAIACTVIGLILLAGGANYASSLAAPSFSSAVVRAGGSTLHAQPDGEVVKDLQSGTILTATGRNADQMWILVQTQDGIAGWVPAATVIGIDLDQLPVMDGELAAQPEGVTPVALPTVTPTAIPLTATATEAAPTATPAAVVAPTTSGQVVLGIVAAQGADLLDAPGGNTVTHVQPGLVLQATARSADSAWVMVQSASDSAVQGWVSVDQLYIVDAEHLPVADATGPPATDAADAARLTPQVTDAVVAESAAIQATVNTEGDRLNIRSGPGTTYTVIAKAADGESYPVLARNGDGSWLQLDTSAGSAAGYGEPSGWAAAEYLMVQGDVDTLPAVEESAPVSEPDSEPPSAPAATPTPQPLTDPGVQTVSTRLPDAQAASGTGLAGTLVFQTSPGGVMYGYDLESGSLWTLTNGFDPAISPDGQTVAYVRDGGENGIYLIDIDGSNERLIFSGRTRLSSPKWSPDGEWIVFTRSDTYTECYSMGRGCIGNLPGGGGMGGGGGDSDDDNGPQLVRIYDYSLARVDRDGNNYRDIASLTSARAADWNEAGIVYQSDAGLQITSDTPDADNQLVTFDYLKPYYDDPDWQPQGGLIAYMGKEASHWEIFSVNPDGSGQRALTRPATTLVDELPSNVAPAWSPDGQSIVFLSNRTGDNEAGAWRLWVMDADGSNQRALPISVAINYTFGGEQAVSWGI